MTPGGRPGLRRGTETRGRILDAAAAVIRERGLGGASTREIARAVGLSEAALYRHFPSRDALITAVLEERLPQFIEVLRGLPERAGRGDVRGTLIEVARAATAFYEQLVPVLASVFSEPGLLARHQEAARHSGLGPHRGNEALAAYLRAEQAQGRIAPSIDPDAAAALMLGACLARGFFGNLLGRDVPLPAADRFAEEIVRVLETGLLPG